ncbi:non-ribosomal peptide synthetase [Cylindrospermum sp. FACHB-282]|uniref:non-ribosomal peptide synthetase n=1 Tax=Cylindrospermum sp. FACHB-282 TaxID=2692794 RepID=UPI001686A6DB|nr:non-ribosomal peptide synthetase [Cylindrospermum sp. FACHB-282]MBD2385751.1 amino acid adenylation domain-containing protein [Cylindrospermum sp. FACHB-282]
MLEEMQGFRLSPQQKYLWHLQQNDQLAYRVQCGVLIEGNLDVNILKLALEKVVERHEILRSNFHCLPGMDMPLQVIRNNSITWRESYDFSSCSIPEQEELLTSLFHQLSKQPFDLVQGSSLNLFLVTLAPSKYILLISLPALCADAETLKILVQEISQSYAACVAGKVIDSEPLQYADLAEWQNELLEGADTEAGRDYWRKQDIYDLRRLKIPGEKQPPEILEFQPQTQTLIIDSTLGEQIETFIQQYNTSLAEFLLACWQILLWRLTQEENLVIGMAFAGRKYQELENALGLFAKLLPLQINLTAESNLIDILSQNCQTIGENSQLQDYFSWEQIAESNTHNSRFFPLCFEFNQQPEKCVAADVSWGIYQQYLCGDRFKVKLSCLRQNRHITAAFHYDSSLFAVEDITRLAGQFQALLASAIANPNATISQLNILSPRERQQLLHQFNNTKQDYPLNKCIHQLFEEQVLKTPHNIAVVFEDQQLTYQQLNQRANQLAHHLQNQGVGPEELVGLCVDRSLEMIVGILGILKAGGAYIPLDPTLPTEALALRLKDAQASVVLTQQHLIATLPHNAAQIICLNSDWETSNTNLHSNVTPENLVYVLFTSGSTGKPKGVAIEHRQLVNYLYGIINRLNLSEGLSFALVSTLAADLGNTSIFPSLCTGGCLHILSGDRATDPTALVEYTRKYPIDCLKIVPAHLASLLKSPTPQALLPRKRLILGGETLSWQLIQQIREYAPDCQIFNHYGPTEATVGVLTYSVEFSNHPQSATVPLGQPLPNTQVYVLENMQLAPVGVKGEIYIGGAGLARCYLHQPELTTEKFIPHPFSDEPEARLYKTGDLGRYLPDGTIEYLGRSDYQVKIRGFRVELGEIETILQQHPNVKEAVVLARDTHLTAYIVQDSPSQINELPSYVRARLPEYMVPSAFVILKALPLTANGKIDRQRLPAPDTARPELEKTFVAPRTPVEEVLAAIWAKLLNLEQVGIDDNFFELGGHSLLLTQVVSQIREAFGVELALRSLFETPTVAGLAQKIETVMGEGQKLAVAPIARMQPTAELPLSFAQQRLWFLDQLEPGNHTYNISRVLRLEGLLNVPALEASFNEILRRHEALRTSFTSAKGEPIQVIAEALNLSIPMVDLRELLPEQQAVEVERLAKLQSQHSFDLSQSPLLKVTLLQLATAEHILLFTIHHIIADGWSAGVLVREVAALYAAFCLGQPSPLPELSLQYADFAVWQRQWLPEVRSLQIAYWQKQLAGNLPVLQLRCDRQRPPMQTFRGKKQSWLISQTLTKKLKSLSQQETVTLFMTLLAAFKTLLYRYTSQADILVGSPIANRNRSEIEGLIGFFVNTIVLRTDLSGNPSFRELLRRVREITLDAYAHQDLPFEQLVEELQPERNLSHSPLFQVMFVLQNASVEVLKLPGLSLSPVEVPSETAQFDITLALTETEQGLMGVWEYNSDLFDAATIARMQAHFQTLLTGIVANPEQRLSELPLLTPPEIEQIQQWNNTQIDYPNLCIHQLFEAQVERTPDAVAVVFENEQLTYQQLNIRANQLAYHLRSLGVGADVLIGICVERSLEMVVGLLAILKAGGAYVPLDPQLPQERLAFILEDAQISLLLTQEHLLKNLPQHHTPVFSINSDWELITQNSLENPTNLSTSENLAYVIYTSGSTGKPKGVLINHSNIVRLFAATEPWFNFNQQDTWTLFHSYAFDFSVWEIWGALIYGGRLIVVPYWVSRSPAAFYDLLCQEQVTVLNQTPSAFRELIAAEETITTPRNLALRWVIFGGEALDVQSLKPWFARHGDKAPRLVNMYGITETTVHVTYRLITATDLSLSIESSIGRPIPDLQVYVLDQQRQLLPVGVPGEMYVGGAGLARGYLNRPELTAQAFVINPFSDQPEACLYKTGDLACYLANGNLQYLGRIDHQVKIRGFRIELGEIEAALSLYPDVLQAVVIAREDVPGDKRLVAYLVSNPGQVLTISSLRHFLQEKLPSYMLPSAFVTLEKLPLTPNGKIDRRALPAADISRTDLTTDFVSPRNPTEEMIAGIWAQVLGVEQVGINDNFFELGGHSLLATQLISRIRQTLGVDLALRSLFASPTIAELANNLQAKLGQTTLPIEPVSRNGNLPLSFAQERLWFLEQLQPDTSIYNMPAAVYLKGNLNLAALEQSLTEIVRRHETLRTSFYVVDGQPFQSITPNIIANLPIVDLQEIPATEQEAVIQRMILEESQRTFNLTQGSLLRCTLLQISQQEHIFLFTIHHIIADGWSLGVFVRELAALYTAFSASLPSPLTELPIQYVDFTIWQKQWLQGEVLAAQLTYWKKQLSGNLPIVQFPTTRPRAEVKTSRGASQSFIIPSPLSASLKMLSRQEGVTLFMTLLATFQVLLQRYTNQDDIVVGTDVANRNRWETEQLIGFFVNLLVLRTDLSGNPTIRELLKRVREVALGAYAHQDLPFEKLVEALRPERNLSNTPPLFQVLFVLQNAPMPALELPGVTLSLMEMENKIARFDLALFLTETEQGIKGKWQYNADLFDTSTITQITSHFQTLLNSMVTQPDAKINSLEMLTDTEIQQQDLQKRERQELKRQKFRSIAPKAVSISSTKLIKTSYLQQEEKFPLVIQPDVEAIDFAEWAKNNREFIETQLLQHGAILFRGFPVNSAAEFEGFAQGICPELFGEYGDLPRAGVSGKIYGSTPYPADKAILFHNESSHLHQWPLKIWFYCVQPSQVGGETPIIDCRKAYKLLQPELGEKLQQKQLMYVRNYTNSLDVSWQNFFHTKDKAVVESYCRQFEIDFEWYDSNCLVTRQIRPALITHPKTGDWVFFNQIQLHHIAYLDGETRDSLLSLFGDERLPRNVYYGDGSPIEDSVISQINQVYQQSQTSFCWQKGDILMLDNMLVAHGRNPYEGQRKIVVAMGEMINSQNITRGRK